MNRVVIIGGGVIGSAVALELLQRHIEVTIVDKGSFGGDASPAAAGMLCPGAEMFDAAGPTDIFSQSLLLYRDWIEHLEHISGVSTQYRASGMLRLIYSEEEERETKTRLKTAPPGCRWLNADAVRAMEPGVADDVRGALLFEQDAQVHPKFLMKGLKAAIMRLGGHIMENTPVLDFLTDESRIRGVHSANGEILADETVVAAGAWTGTLLEPLDVVLPVVPVKGEMMALVAPVFPIRHVLQGPDGMILPRQDGTVHVGVTMEEAGYDHRRTARAVHQIYQTVLPWAPWVRDAEWKASWAGLRPKSPDGAPYIGRVPGWKGLSVASGHYSVGIFLAPITGRLIADTLLGRRPLIDTTPYSPERLMR